jgi:O-antigen ligase
MKSLSLQTIFSKSNIILFFCWVVIASIIYSPFVLTVGMIGLAAIALFRVEIGTGRFPIQIDWEAIKKVLRLHRSPDFWMISLFFFMILWDYSPNQDMDFWLTRLRIKIPFIAFPLMFYFYPKITERQFNGLFYFLLVALCITAIGIIINYFLHQAEIIELMKKGKPMPTPRNHIRLSLLTAYGIIGGIYLSWKQFFWRKPREKKLIIGMTIFLFLFIHFLSVRTGILALYAALLMLGLGYAFAKKRYLMGIGVVLVVSAMPLLAYHFVPSVKAKIAYMIWDWQQYQKGEGDIYADAGRIYSLIVGWEIVQESPIRGTKMGHLRPTVQQKFAEQFPNASEIHMPHNQFLYIAAGSGLLGLAVFLFAWLFPFFYKGNFRHPLMLGLYAISFVAFMLEHSIENSIGVAFFIFFLMLLVNHLRRDVD